jgi:hypothetical protein
MKKIIFIVCFSCFGHVYGQSVELQGIYSASFMGSESIHFVGIDSFYFDGFYCINGVQGKGRCEIKNDFLILNFEKARSTTILDTLQTRSIKKTKSIDSLSIFNITCLDNNGNPVQYSSVTIDSKGEKSVLNISDSIGNTMLMLRKNTFPIDIRINGLGFKEKIVTINEVGNYYFTLTLNRYKIIEILNNGEQYIYEIETLSEDLITMRRKNSGGRFLKFIKREKML